jgi:carboxymethylenebutenolidase
MSRPAHIRPIFGEYYCDSFYGGGVEQGRFGYPPMTAVAGALQTPWQGFFGDRDESIPTEHVEALRTAAATAPVDTAIVRYADAQHGFHCDDRPAVLNAEAAADAWSETLKWFEGHIAKP